MTDYISREAVLREIRECFNNNGWYGNSRVELLNAIAALPGIDYPTTSVSVCNCDHHRRGESSGGWYCPAHGQQL